MEKLTDLLSKTPLDSLQRYLGVTDEHDDRFINHMKELKLDCEVYAASIDISQQFNTIPHHLVIKAAEKTDEVFPELSIAQRTIIWKSVCDRMMDYVIEFIRQNLREKLSKKLDTAFEEMIKLAEETRKQMKDNPGAPDLN